MLPLKVDIAALTVTVPADTVTWLALIVTCAEASMVMPLVSSLIELLLLSTISTAPGPSFKASCISITKDGELINCLLREILSWENDQ